VLAGGLAMSMIKSSDRAHGGGDVVIHAATGKREIKSE
jgi:hypothetical protein